MLVAIDGPAGSGKSTVTEEVARRLGTVNINTGFAYRAAALVVLREGLNPEDEEAVVHAARGIKISEKGATIDGVPVKEEDLRSPEASAMASRISAQEQLRRLLVPVQRQAAYGASGGAVVEGRDIGTVILPEADLKIFLEAPPEERARRRAEQSGKPEEFERIKEAMEKRDSQDRQRSRSPLKPAADAVFIDTTGLGIEEVVERVVSLIREKGE